MSLAISSFSQNYASLYGGALASDESNTEVSNSTFSGNTSDGDGGGLEASGSRPLALTNCTVVNNTLTGAGRGDNIFTGSANSNVNIRLKNSIIAGATANNCNASVTSLGNNIESSDSCGLASASDLRNTDPMLDTIGNNGGPTKTHALLSGSPAVDSGSASGCPSVDQRGFIRPQDGDGNGGPACDIGAVEQSFAGVSIRANASILSESSGTAATFTVSRQGDLGVPLSVRFSISGSAALNSDFSMSLAPPATILIPIGADSATITLTPVNDSVAEADESVTLTLGAGPGYAVTSPSSATVSIISDEVVLPNQGTPNSPDSTLTIGEALDLNLNWRTSGHKSWVAQRTITHDGSDAVQAGPVPLKKASSLSASIVGPAKVSFWWKTISAKNDKLSFSIGRKVLASRGGNGNWQKRTFKLPKGKHALRWSFKPTSKASASKSVAYLDEVSIAK